MGGGIWVPLLHETHSVRMLAVVVVFVVALVIDLARPPRVLLIGDSITRQYGPSAAATLRRHGYDAVVRAYPGGWPA
jgi:hypothetical protein